MDLSRNCRKAIRKRISRKSRSQVDKEVADASMPGMLNVVAIFETIKNGFNQSLMGCTFLQELMPAVSSLLFV
jgi:hypothetical protein